MRVISRGLGVLAIASLLASPMALARLPGKGVQVQPLASDVDSELFQTYVIIEGLRRLGYEVLPVKRTAYAGLYPPIANGRATFTASHWFPTHSAFYRLNGGDARFYRQGSLVNAVLQGYMIDRKTAETCGYAPGVKEECTITHLDQLKDPSIARLFDHDGDGRADLVGCPNGWGCQEIIDTQLKSYELRRRVTHHKEPYDAAMAETVRRFEAGQPVLFYSWSSNWVAQRLVPGKDVVWLQVPYSALPGDRRGEDTSLPDGRNYGFARNSLRVVANRQFADANPAAARLFEVAWLLVVDINEQIEKMQAGEDSTEDVRRHVAEWIADNQLTFDSWLREAQRAHDQAIYKRRSGEQ